MRTPDLGDQTDGWTKEQVDLCGFIENYKMNEGVSRFLSRKGYHERKKGQIQRLIRTQYLPTIMKIP